VNRLTASGFRLNPAESLTVDEALHAVTLGAAWTLGMEGEVGSIETGKRADFAVLDEDPRAVDPLALKDIRVRGTVLDGVSFADA
jgi:predicted amidohydrolase YtcJ